MSRPKTPTNVLKMRGAYDNHPERAKEREHEPMPTEPLGGPFEWMDETQRAMWVDMANGIPAGVAFEPDRQAFGMLVCLFCQFVVEQADMSAPKMGQLNKLLTQFGLTPADRSRVKATLGKKQADPWDEL